jgi:hypothetical protein
MLSPFWWIKAQRRRQANVSERREFTRASPLLGT